MMNELTTRYIPFLLVLWAALLSACSSSDVTEASPTAPAAQADVAVTFDSYLQRTSATRAASPSASYTGLMDDDDLQAAGFGVFAHYTGTSTFDYDAAGNGAAPYNFMWNQPVTYATDHWTYSPVKYWPNDNQPADDGTAQGSQEHSYVSFFGYAPYTADGTLPAAAGDHGIVGMTANTAAAGQGAGADKGTYLTYRTNTGTGVVPYEQASNIDLLWAKQANRYKMDGGGYVNGKVNMLFKHALSLFTISVQGLFDHTSNADASTQYPDDRDMYTHILVESVDFGGSPLYSEGNMYLAPRPDNAEVPYWELDDTKFQNISVDSEHINPEIANSYLDGTWKKYWDADDSAASFLQLSDLNGDGAVDEADGLLLSNGLPKGVSHTEVPLYRESDYYYMVLPNKDYMADHTDKKMKVRMVYYTITYDPRLELNNPKYFSIVKNDITATFPTFSFEPNKKYKLLLQPGLTSVKFTVTMVDGWDTPLTLDPEVVDWYVKTLELDVR